MTLSLRRSIRFMTCTVNRSHRLWTARNGYGLGAQAIFLTICLGTTSHAQTLVNGGSVISSISAPGEKDTYTFNANAGEGFLIHAADPALGALIPGILIMDPNGAQFAFFSDPDVAEINAFASISGTYTVIIADDSTAHDQTGPYEVHFALAPGANEGGSLPNGGMLTDFISFGDIDSYSFNLNAGENFQLRIVDLNAGSLIPEMNVYDPNGGYLSAASASTVGVISGVATITGTHTLIIADNNISPSQTGPYGVHYIRAPGANEGGLLPNDGSITSSLTVGDLDSFTFALNTGESFQLQVVDDLLGSMVPNVTIYDPLGNFSFSFESDDVATLTSLAGMSGIYTVVISDSSSANDQSGPYTVHFASAPGANEGGLLTGGSQVSGSIDLGDIDSFTFDLQAGDGFQIQVADSSQSAFFPRATVYRPNGAYLIEGQDDNVVSIIGNAPASGTYTIILKDQSIASNQTGTYDLYLVSAPGPTEGGFLLDGQFVSGTIAAGDLDSYSFLGFAGDSAQITLAETTPSSLNPSFNLYDPTGLFLTTVSGPTVASFAFGVPTSGVYTLVVADSNTPAVQSGPYSIVIVGSGADPNGINSTCPAGSASDPELRDVGGSLNLGPRIADATQPFNASIDCSGAVSSGIFLMQINLGKLGTPINTKFGPLYLTGPVLLQIVGTHTISAETWAPTPAGIVLPNDPSLVGLSFAVQGFCGGFPTTGRLSNSLNQTIGG